MLRSTHMSGESDCSGVHQPYLAVRLLRSGCHSCGEELLYDAALPDTVPGYGHLDACPAGCGVWAPSIRHHAGRFYIYYGDPDIGIFCIRSEKTKTIPCRWEPAVLVKRGKGLIDPCPLWDEDGRCYLVHAFAGSRAGFKSALAVCELNPDGLSVLHEDQLVFDGHQENPTCEGPKFHKRNGFYYILCPAGGVKTGWQLCLRSKSVYGPYEWRRVLEQGSTAINAPHQGAWVDDKFYHFQDVGTAGRIVHLQPLKWQDNWPVIGNNGEPVLSMGENQDTAKDAHPLARLAMERKPQSAVLLPRRRDRFRRAHDERLYSSLHVPCRRRSDRVELTAP